ncbi:MAG: tetrahydrofolate dehydrogenase/cyclohydrolase catalytic domain-containing protein, partial [Candidatus Aminicenantales bacterium]
MGEPLVLDGKTLAKKIEESLKPRINRIIERSGGRVPVLATILVGDDPASATYVRMKGNACRRVGMESRKIAMPASTTTDELLAAIKALNEELEARVERRTY